ncbi:MAG: signal peptidase I [Alphaproteobacteria bacterium]
MAYEGARVKDGESKGGFWENVRTIVYAVLIALMVRTFAYEPFNIPSGSMLPTLLVGDYLFVSKFSYGYSRHSLPLSLPLIPGRVLFTEPDRGDVAVFKLPTDGKTDYIKRIVGLPGDEIQMRGGRLHINGVVTERARIDGYVVEGGFGRSVRVPQYLETLPGGRSYSILESSGDEGQFDNTPVFKVPARHYFAMGDNRDNSLDSRASVGFIPAENLIGRAEFLFFSVDGSARIWEVWKWPWAIRWERIFNAVDP